MTVCVPLSATGHIGQNNLARCAEWASASQENMNPLDFRTDWRKFLAPARIRASLIDINYRKVTFSVVVMGFQDIQRPHMLATIFILFVRLQLIVM